jgi:4-amino-4-deoxy-L-arabinose transferase-like glycosyltransferase
MMPRRLHRLIDALWLLALCAYILAGIPVTTFHGDEAMQIHMSRDFVTAFLERAPERLMTSPPYPIDSDGHLRILNGTVNRYTIGLSWYLAGFMPDDLPPPPGWDWGLNYAQGVATGHRPSDALLTTARLPSALFLCGSVIVMFGLGWLFGGRHMAYFASGLFALNPIILLNGRRAMQEGSMLFFGLLTIYAAALLSQRRTQGKESISLWLLMAASGTLALASKHTSIVFIAGAGVWLLAAEFIGRRAFAGLIARLAVWSIAVVLGFVGLSPALWNGPPARFGDLLAVRSELIDIQIAIDPIAPTTLPQRIAYILVQPFTAPPVHYELTSWGEDSLFLSEIDTAMRSPLSGIHFGWLIGGALTIVELIGIVDALRKARSSPLHAGLLAWLAVTLASLLANPLPWQRYFLPFIPLTTLFAGIGVWQLTALLRSNRTAVEVIEQAN